MDVLQSVPAAAPSWTALILGGNTPFFTTAHSYAGDAFQQNPELQPILFDKGRVLFGRFTITGAQFTPDSITWAHESDRGFTSGSLMYAKSGTELHGTVSVGDEPSTASETAVFATAIPLSEYVTQLSSKTAPGAAHEGPILRIGVRADQGLAPSISVFLDATDVSDGVSQSLEPESGRPVLDIFLPRTLGGPLGSGAAHIVFDIGENGDVSFAGHYTTINKNGDVVAGDWTGRRRPPVDVDNALVETETPPLAFVDALLPSGENSLSEAELEAPEVQKAVLALLGKVPNDNEVSQASSGYMMENMKYAMWLDSSDDEVTSRRKWMQNFLKEQRPTIQDQARIGAITKNGDWYRNTMATSILGNALSQQVFEAKVVPRPLDAQRKLTLQGYVAECLPKDETYAEQQSALWRTVYLDRAPTLKAYVEEDKAKLAVRADKTNPPETWDQMTWAERVLEYATAPKQFQIITDNLMAGGSSTPDVSAAEEKISAAKLKIGEFEKKLTDRRTRLASLKASPSPDADMITAMEDLIASLESTIAVQREAVANLEEQKADQEKKALLTMRNMSSLLYALDTTGNLSKTYMDGVSMASISRSAQSANIHELENYENTLSDFLATFFDDVAHNRNKVFGSIDETGDLNDLMRTEALDTKRLAAEMVRALVNARQSTFLGSSSVATQTFSQKYPRLTGAFRVGLIAAYVFTVLKVLQTVQQGTGSSTTVEDVMTYGTFASLTLETFRSLLANTKGLFKGVFNAVAGEPAIPGQVSTVGRWFSKIGDGIARAFTWIATGIRSLGTRVAEGLATTRVFSALRNFCSRFIGAVVTAVRAAGNKIVGGISSVISRIAQSPTWIRFSSFMGKMFGVIAKGFMVISSIWLTVTEGINMVSVWKTSNSGWQKALVTMQFAAVALSTIATVIGVFSSAVVWSGAGAILALVAVGIGILVSYLWPPESTIQKIISEVITPFVDQTAGPALQLARNPAVASPPPTEPEVVLGRELAFA